MAMSQPAIYTRYDEWKATGKMPTTAEWEAKKVEMAKEAEPEVAAKQRDVPSLRIVPDNQAANGTLSDGTSFTGIYDNTHTHSGRDDKATDTEGKSILSVLPENDVPSLETPETTQPPQPPAALAPSLKRKRHHRIDPSGALILVDGLSYSDTAKAIMQSSGCSIRAAEKYLKDALASGLVEVDTTGPGKPTFYFLTESGLEWAYKSGDATSRGYWRKKLRARS
jgi:hypothetical protein